MSDLFYPDIPCGTVHTRKGGRRICPNAVKIGGNGFGPTQESKTFLTTIN